MEVCVDSLESVIAAYEGGASRVEVCSSLNEGGLTPTLGLLRSSQNFLVKQDKPRPFGLHCMIRCRAGDFNYSDNELETMNEDLKRFVETELADGIVFGALTPEVIFFTYMN